MGCGMVGNYRSMNRGVLHDSEAPCEGGRNSIITKISDCWAVARCRG